MLPKEEKHVRGREVVVRHGGGDRELPLARHGAPSQTLCGTAWRNTKKRSVKGEEEIFWGSRHGGQAS